MADSSTKDFTKEKKIYTAVAIALFTATFVALAIGKIEFFDLGAPGPGAMDLFIGLGLAGFKASLVALIFMHLNHEKGLIYKTLFFTVIFFAGMMALTLFAEFDPIREQYDTIKTTGGKLLETELYRD